MAVKLEILSTLPLLLLLFLLQLVTSMPRSTKPTSEEPVLMIYSTGKNKIGVKNGSNIYSFPTPGEPRLAAYDPKHAELYLTLSWRPHSSEEAVTGETGTVYRVKLSGNQAERDVRAFVNAAARGVADPQYGPRYMAYDDLDDKLYFCDDGGVGSCGRDMGNCSTIYDFSEKSPKGCPFALNPTKGTLYLEEPQRRHYPTIHKGSKDGTGQFVKIIQDANFFTVDPDSGLLFYIAVRDPTNSTKPAPGTRDPTSYVYDIMKSDSDGKNRELVHTLEGLPASRLQVAGERVYWAEGRGRGKYLVFSCYKFSGKDLREHQLDGLDDPYGFVTLLVANHKNFPLQSFD